MTGQLIFWGSFAAFAWPIVAWNRLDRQLQRDEREEREQRTARRVRKW
jgi:hypothetical protein